MSTAATPGHQNAALNGTTYVDILAAPASSKQRRAMVINVCNVDTVTHTFYLAYDDNGTVRMIWNGGITLAPNDAIDTEMPQILDTTTRKLKMKMGEAMTTTNPDVTVGYVEFS